MADKNPLKAIIEFILQILTKKDKESSGDKPSPHPTPEREPKDPSSNPTKTLASAVVQEAYKHLNVPYKYGGNAPSEGFDCSGLVVYVFSKQGIQLPRVSSDQAEEGREVSRAKMKKGDLVYFGTDKRRINHIGIVVSPPGEQLSMIHSSSSKGVIVTDVDNSSYWRERIQGFRRVL